MPHSARQGGWHLRSPAPQDGRPNCYSCGPAHQVMESARRLTSASKPSRATPQRKDACVEPHHGAKSESDGDGGVVSEALGKAATSGMELGCCLAPKVTGQAVRTPPHPTTGPWPSPQRPCLPELPLPAKRHQGSRWDQEQNMRVVRARSWSRAGTAAPPAARRCPLGSETREQRWQAPWQRGSTLSLPGCANIHPCHPFQCLEGQRSPCCYARPTLRGKPGASAGVLGAAQ